VAAANAAQRVPVEERLFSLVLALLATDHGLTKSEILSTVQGYRQRYSPNGDNANLERQFERDKDDIRELGVPLETIEPPGQAGNNQNLRYRIPRGAYELPRDIAFSAEETALLGLAAMVWREGSLSGESRRATMKLKALGIETVEPVLAYAPRVRVREAAFDPLAAAVEKHQVVRFGYLKPGESEASARTVAPLALLQFQGRWHCYAVEPDTGERKTFLLRRIVGQVVATGATVAATGDDEAERGLRELEEVWESHLAEVRVAPDTDAATRLQKQRGAGTTADGALLLHYVDANILADELASFGPEVVVVAPLDLREAVRGRLLSVAAAHAGPAARGRPGEADHG
jgi:proteasome accessory factor B